MATSPESLVKALLDRFGRTYAEQAGIRLADQLDQRWGGDLRKLRDEAGRDLERIHGLLTEFKGIGPVGASIFLREVQAVWSRFAPYVDERVLRGAEKVGLPLSARKLAGLVDSPAELVRLSSALIRVSQSSRTVEEIKHAMSG